jgi:hypothetical protein
MHFREMLGSCYLFGDIVGFEWVKSPTEVLVLDVRGNTVGVKEQVAPAGGGTLTIGNKRIPSSISGCRWGRLQLHRSHLLQRRGLDG